MPDILPIPKFGCGLAFEARPDLGETYAQIYRENLDFAAEAEQLGLEVIWCAEHHGDDSGYIPSALMGAAAVAAVTKTCRVGTNIALAPLYGHPLRLAEEAAIVDNISGGRFDLGLGLGYRADEYQAYGLPFEGRTAAFREILEVLKCAWTGERFDFDGAVYQTRGGLLRPKPVHPGGPPLWIGATAPAARKRVVKHRAGLTLNPLADFESTARQVASFDRSTAEAGIAALPKALSREIVLGESGEDAIRRRADIFDHVYRVQYSPERTGMTYIDPNTGARVPLTSDHPYYLSLEFMRERWWVGAPEEVADAIVEQQRRLKLSVITFNPRAAGMRLEDSLEDVKRVMTLVAPRVREKLAALNAAAQTT